MVRALPYLVPIALLLYALIDLSRSEAAERADVPLVGWLLIVVLLPVVGPVTWIVVSRTRRTRAAASGRPAAPAARPAPRRTRGPVAPDDDPEFLWRLEQERRRHRRAPGGPGSPGSGAPGPADDAPNDTP